MSLHYDASDSSMTLIDVLVFDSLKFEVMTGQIFRVAIQLTKHSQKLVMPKGERTHDGSSGDITSSVVSSKFSAPVRL